MNADRPVKRALISVYDKTGIVEFARFLEMADVEIVSTGGTAKVLKDAGIPVVELSSYTGYPEMLSGRVKSLHPKVHGGLLYIRGNDEHEATVRKHGIGSIDILVVNLYPFEDMVGKPGVSAEEIIENIDIGGPAMLRSAAKNYASVAVITDPADYQVIMEEIKTLGGITQDRRKCLAGKAFERTASYDRAIATYFGQENTLEETVSLKTSDENSIKADVVPPSSKMEKTLDVSSQLVQSLRYGENPHQKAALYGNWNEYYKQLSGKELSYNNILDLTAAAELIAEFNGDRPTVAIFKHTNPCGVGQGKDLREAWVKAYETDKHAPFGGIIAANREIDIDAANVIKEIFSEVIVAPSFSAEALRILSAKKNLRLIQVLKDPRSSSTALGTSGAWRMRSVGAESFVMQENDMKQLAATEFKVVTKRHPTPDELKAMLFAWRVVKHVKSNAIVYADPNRTLGIGAGQMSRVDSSRIAVWKAGEAGLNLAGSAIASDAFFPFPDALVAAADAGATAVIQPGGSVKDSEIIKAADERNMVMVFTGVRHFRH